MGSTMIAPAPITEAEIRRALRGIPIDLDPDAGGAETSGAAWDAFGTLWVLSDFRPSEDAVYTTIVSEAMDRIGEHLRERFRALVVEELTRAGIAFAAEYPDAPRAVR
jgi:hypothetical protein